MILSAVTLAHYGGIDEIGVFVLPAVAVILVLRWAERRARQRAEPEDIDPADGSADVPEQISRSADPLSSPSDE
ncbi:MAG: hypothetical protein ACRDGH_17295 [Candidatus Limnocylindria bacterium]